MYQVLLVNPSSVPEGYTFERLKFVLNCDESMALHIVKDVEINGEAPCFVGDIGDCQAIRRVLRGFRLPTRLATI